MSEINERKNREKNILIFGVPECPNGEPAEKNEKDKKMIQEMSSHCGVKIGDKDIIRISRIGKPKPTGDHRPMLVAFEALESKIELFKNLSKLKDSPYDSVRINHDLTKAQRAENKRLIEQAQRQERESGGKTMYRVRGPPWNRQVKMIRQHQSEQLESPPEASQD